jgi:hypothetical protein
MMSKRLGRTDGARGRSWLAAASGATKRQVEHWTAQRMLPSLRGAGRFGKGHHVTFTEEDSKALAAAISAQAMWGESAARRVLAEWV